MLCIFKKTFNFIEGNFVYIFFVFMLGIENKRYFLAFFLAIWMQVFIPGPVEASTIVPGEMLPKSFVSLCVFGEGLMEDIVSLDLSLPTGKFSVEGVGLTGFNGLDFWNKLASENLGSLVERSEDSIVFIPSSGKKVRDQMVKKGAKTNKQDGSKCYSWIAYLYHSIFCLLVGWFIYDIKKFIA